MLIALWVALAAFFICWEVRIQKVKKEALAAKRKYECEVEEEPFEDRESFEHRYGQ